MAELVKHTDKISIFYGCEACSVEDVHLICLFGELAAAMDFGAWIKTYLPALQNNAEYFGDQPIVDADNNIIGIEKALLIGATDLSIDQIIKKSHSLNGVVIASHVDRRLNGLFGQLGIWPSDAGLDGYDVSINGNPADYKNQISANIKYIRSSDAHYLADIGQISSKIELESPTFAAFVDWLKNCQP